LKPSQKKSLSQIFLGKRARIRKRSKDRSMGGAMTKSKHSPVAANTNTRETPCAVKWNRNWLSDYLGRRFAGKPVIVIIRPHE